ncbi:MAG: efflux transporter outer membrane subunit [Verrucomicrobia bacterium]|nr:efflux transporter outer membrane subunit [Verrucomicrobiota bacterium]
MKRVQILSWTADQWTAPFGVRPRGIGGAFSGRLHRTTRPESGTGVPHSPGFKDRSPLPTPLLPSQGREGAERPHSSKSLKAALCALGVLSASLPAIAGPFTVGPDYQRPTNAVPTAYKASELGEWKQGQPLDHVPKGAWWEMFSDETLNGLELRATKSNQELKAAIARVDQARATARVARSELLPGLSVDPSVRRERFSPHQVPSFGDITANTFRAPLDLSYEIDLWGRVRRGFESAKADAQASLAAFYNVWLTLQADVAQNYFALRALDAEIATVASTAELRREQVRLVRSRFEGGIGNELDVARAETELATTEAEAASLAKRRAELENALAILVGENPAAFRLNSRRVPPHPGPLPRGEGESFAALALAGGIGDVRRSNGDSLSVGRGQGEGKGGVDSPGGSKTETHSWNPPLPDIPAGLPSDLLERRPDVAEAERQLSAANARIGVAKAAFFPVLRLTGSGGYVSGDIDNLFNWDSRVWSIGPSLSLPIFAGGRHRANYKRSQAAYEEAIAGYRQRVLVAFGEVENSLAAIRHLSTQSAAQDRAVANARRAAELAGERYRAGIVSYLEVVDANRATLQTERSSVQLAGQRLIAAVQLIKALGGGWQSGDLQAASSSAKTSRQMP